MTNPYQAPQEKTESPIGSGRRLGLVGCGCALAFLGFLVVGFAMLFVNVEERVPVPLPVAPPQTRTASPPNPVAPPPPTDASDASL